MLPRPIAHAELALPAPDELGGPPLAYALARRRSVREFRPRRLTLQEIGQLLWAAQGITDSMRGLRTAPSAGALYPLEIDAVTRDGVYRYGPHGHMLTLRDAADVRAALALAALLQDVIAKAPCVFAIHAVPARTSVKYPGRAERYATLEAGHAAQNLVLQACALGLGAVTVGAIDNEGVARTLNCAHGEKPLYLIAAGVPLKQ
ncbi:MAG TPA: SagB/ThcOx family dehydrogenase [Burkholderiales bacterium]|nr:SagB/ThcOx family dehydrogenase [Burkholderiales bacterium]